MNWNWNWNAIGAVGQILGSLATFVTVGFLAVQMHDSNQDTKRVIAQSRQERNIQSNMMMATHPHLAALHIKASRALRADPDKRPPLAPFFEAAIDQWGFTSEEALMLGSEMTAWWNSTSLTILYAHELIPGDRTQFDNSLRNGLSLPARRFWYESSKSGMNPDAVRYVDNLLAQPK